MRKLTRFLFFALLTIAMHAQTTTTYRTEVIDGNNNFSSTLEKFNYCKPEHRFLPLLHGIKTIFTMHFRKIHSKETLLIIKECFTYI
jgi:hypothetical protein